MSADEGEEIPRPDSSASSIISRTSSLHDDVFTANQEDLQQKDAEKVSTDVATRGIVRSNKYSEPIAQSGIRGMLIAACEVSTGSAENGQETGEASSHNEQQTNEEAGSASEEINTTSQEMYFFNKDSSTSRARGPVKPKKFSGPVAQSGNSKNSPKTDEIPLQDKIEQQINKDAWPAPGETDPTSQQIDLFNNKDSSTSRPSSASSTTSIADKREVSFQASDEDHFLKKEKSLISHTGNTTVEVVSVCTQTEWSWMNDMLQYQEMITKAERKERRASISKSPSGNSHAGSMKRRRKSQRSVGSRKASMSSDQAAQGNDEENSSLPEVEEGHDARLSLAGLEEGSTGRSKSKSSGGVPRSRQSVVSSLPRTPKGEDALFRPTTVEPDSSSDSEDYENYDLEREYLLPSIGPPAILQYMKESQHPPMSNEEVEDREELAKSDMLKKSMFSGPCMFCQEEILPFPTIEELERLLPDQLFCCPQYERLVNFELAQRNDSGHLIDEMIDIKPHAPYGTKAARRAAKERAAERAREREMERQRAAGANPTNFYALTRQMKTITYSLASTKCMEEGWTVRPETPSSTDAEQIQDPFVIEVNPLPLRKHTFLERFYDNKRRFLLLLPDGTGTCYYPSGNIAVMITATEKGKFTYLVYDDDENRESNPSGMLAIFDPSGHGTCYFRNGSVRLVLNPFFGVLMDHRGTRKKKWLWHNLKEHVHAPPFQPITFSITKQLSIRCLSQNKTVLTFNQGKYTARFNVGSKLKAVAKAKPPTGRDSYETHLAEVKQFVNIVLDRYQNAMRLPNYPRLDKIPLPLHLQKTKEAGKKSRLRGSSSSGQRETTVIVN